MGFNSPTWHGESRAVVLLSGGLDSTLTLMKAVYEFGPERVSALTLHYGQKHDREIYAAEDVAAFFAIEHETFQLARIFGDANSTLIEGGPDNPKTTYKKLSLAKGVSPTYVPFRNGNLLSAAASRALAKDAGWLYYGPHAEDSRNWAYPDCTPEFNGAMANAIFVGTYGKVRLVTPLQNYTKAQIVAELMDDVNYEVVNLTWSCYEGGDAHCGECPTCVARIQAFKDNDYADPVDYLIDIDWRT